MNDIHQLIKLEGTLYGNVFPKAYVQGITDKNSGKTLDEILSNFNMYFLSYDGDIKNTRLQVPLNIRKKGLWVTYINLKGNVVTEWYNNNSVEDKDWENSDNWIDGSNMLSGDLAISSEGYWVINGVNTKLPARGKEGITPLLRGFNGKLQVSYNNGESFNYLDLPTFVKEDNEDIKAIIDSNGIKELKFADKAYNPAEFSGLGRVILRKNIVNGKNVLTQEMINKPNTIYEIRYDFDLNDAEIDIPENCTLDFQGGGFSNGTLNGNNTKIKSLIYRIFNSIYFNGTFLCKQIYIEWFNLYPANNKNLMINLQKELNELSMFINSLIGTCIVNFKEGFYGFGGEGSKDLYKFGNYGTYRKSALTIQTAANNIIINGNGAKFYNIVNNHYGAWNRNNNNYTIAVPTDAQESKAVATVYGSIIYIRSGIKKSNIEIYDIYGNYGYKERIYGGLLYISSTQSGIEINDDYDNIIIKNCIFENNITDGINIAGNKGLSININNCKIYNSGRSGISIGDVKNNVSIENCYIYNSGNWEDDVNFRYESVGASINFEPVYEESGKCYINNCIFDCFAYAALSFGKTNLKSFKTATINNTLFKNKHIGKTYINNKIEYLSSFPKIGTGCLIDNCNYNNCTCINTTFDPYYFNNNYLYDIKPIYNFNNILLYFDSNYFEDTKDYIPIIYMSESNVLNSIININNINVYSHPKLQISLINEQPYSITWDNLNLIVKHKIISPIISRGNKKVINNLNIFNDFYLIENTLITEYLLTNIAHNINYTDLKSTGFVPFIIEKKRDVNIAKIHSTGDIVAYTKNFNFIKLAKDNSTSLLIGTTSSEDLIKTLPNNSIIINDTDINNNLFSVIKQGKFKYFFSIKKGLPYNSIDNINNIDNYIPEKGETCFDENKNILSIWNGISWIDSQGNAINSIRKGTTAQRPTGVQIGFTYKDTDLNKWIIWNGEAWENIDGTALV